MPRAGDEIGDRALADVLEELVLGAPHRYTRSEVDELTGLDPEAGRRLWLSLGFPEVTDEDAIFTERDVEAVRLMSELGEAGVLEPDVREAVARATAQAMSRLAEWQVGMVRRVLESEGAGATPERAVELAATALPALERLQAYVWRRHLAATVRRLVVSPSDEAGEQWTGSGGEADTWPLVVGFADMVGFTRATRQRSTAELGELIERFGSSTTEVIADRRGRIVKTVGDEVLFVADDAADAAAIALDLLDRVRAEEALPDLRVGLAAGPVLVRYGDVYGEVVNIASRLTGRAAPGSALVDRTVADALRDHSRFAVRALRPVAVRGYRRLHPWALTRRGHARS